MIDRLHWITVMWEIALRQDGPAVHTAAYVLFSGTKAAIMKINVSAPLQIMHGSNCFHHLDMLYAVRAGELTY